MPFKAVLGDLEWKIFLIALSWWATLKTTFAVIFVRKTHESIFESYIEPWYNKTACVGAQIY